MLKKHAQIFSSISVLADIVIASSAWIIAYYLRFHIIRIPPPAVVSQISNYLPMILAIAVVWPFIFQLLGLYRPRRTKRISDEIIRIVHGNSLGVACLVIGLFFVRNQEIARLVLMYFWLTSIAMISGGRWAARLVFRYIRRKKYNVRRVLIVGAGQLGSKTVRVIEDNSWTGLDIVGYVDNEVPVGTLVDNVPVLDTADNILHALSAQTIDQVFIALPAKDYALRREILEAMGSNTVTVRLIPDIYQGITLNASVELLDDLPIINLSDTPLYGWSLVLKRMVDISCALLALFVTAPLQIAIAIGIKLTSKGPILFRQRRYGLDGKIVWVHKYRTMKVLDNGEEIIQARKNDPRLTNFGRILRRTSLDELPQFFNVLQGHMSVVGPRPHAVAHNEFYRKKIKGYMLRHKIKPGVTGWAQVNGLRGETDTILKMKMRVDYDLYYIEHWSIFFDIKIMVLTLWRGFTDKHAY